MMRVKQRTCSTVGNPIQGKIISLLFDFQEHLNVISANNLTVKALFPIKLGITFPLVIPFFVGVGCGKDHVVVVIVVRDVVASGQDNFHCRSSTLSAVLNNAEASPPFPLSVPRRFMFENMEILFFAWNKHSKKYEKLLC